MELEDGSDGCSAALCASAAHAGNRCILRHRMRPFGDPRTIEGVSVTGQKSAGTVYLSGMASPDLLPAYAELHCLSNFSFLRGASHPEELVERANSQGYAALALTDECSLAGAVRAHLAAKDVALPLILGSEFTLADGLKLVLLATDRESYGDLSQLITRGRRNAVKGTYRLIRDDVATLAASCIAQWFPALDLRAADRGRDALRDAGF